MQYLLSQEEIGYLQECEARLKELGPAGDRDKLQEFCTWVACNTPIKYWDNKEANIWGCPKAKIRERHMDYCDECPARKFCPNEYKSWSK